MSESHLDRRIQRTRDLLQRAAMELIAEKGYDAVKVSDITERANLGRTTFYLHYQNKADLLLSGHERSFFKTAFEVTTLEKKLRRWFNEKDSSIPFSILENYIAGAQLSLLAWWLESRIAFSPQHGLWEGNKAELDRFRDCLSSAVDLQFFIGACQMSLHCTITNLQLQSNPSIG
jgi:AcrR family transcriptional regulator